jgi:hypothetical protein
VRAALDILRKVGHCVKERRRPTAAAVLGEGIAANRWARQRRRRPVGPRLRRLDYVDVLNSWGRGYPHLTRMPATVLERLWKEDGEVGIVTIAETFLARSRSDRARLVQGSSVVDSVKVSVLE